MAIIGFDENEIIEYTPVRDRKSGNPCIIKMKHVPFKKVQQYAKRINLRNMNAMDADERTANFHTVQREQFIENIIGIENFLVKGVEVKDAETFYEKADSALIEECLRAMESAAILSEGQRKNL